MSRTFFLMVLLALAAGVLLPGLTAQQPPKRPATVEQQLAAIQAILEKIEQRLARLEERTGGRVQPGVATAVAGSANVEADGRFVPFGEVTANLMEERLTRYIRVKITLVVDPGQAREVRAAVEKNRPILKAWVLTTLAEKSLKAVAGAENIKRIRAQIHEAFNAMLFKDGDKKIKDVLFEDYLVQ